MTSMIEGPRIYNTVPAEDYYKSLEQRPVITIEYATPRRRLVSRQAANNLMLAFGLALFPMALVLYYL